MDSLGTELLLFYAFAHSFATTRKCAPVFSCTYELLVHTAECTAIGKDEQLRRFYFRLESRKNSAVAWVAVARKLVLRLYRMLREEIDYHEFRRRGRDARRARVGLSSVARRD